MDFIKTEILDILRFYYEHKNCFRENEEMKNEFCTSFINKVKQLNDKDKIMEEYSIIIIVLFGSRYNELYPKSFPLLNEILKVLLDKKSRSNSPFY